MVRTAEFAFGLGGDGGELVGVPQEKFALWSERDVAAGAVEEANTKFIFEGLDLKGHRGLREEELVGGFTEVEVMSDSAEDFEAEVLELGHGRIIYGRRIGG